jgi:gluconolactonase
MKIEKYDAALDDLISPSAELELLANGFQFTEGPIWDEQRQCLYFSDIPANTMYQFSHETSVQEYRKPSNFSNGLTLDHDACLLACEHHTRRVTRTTENGIEVLADSYMGKRLNSPNDVIVTRDGGVLFTDPHYGLLEGLGGPAEQELAFKGVYRLAPNSSELSLLVSDFDAPNGLALSIDEKRLYVDDSIRSHIRVFDVNEDWTLSGGAVFAELSRDGLGDPDGMKLDYHGNIFCAGPGGIWIFSPSGVKLGRLLMPEVTANLNWGDDDACSLYITASSSVYRLRCMSGGRAGQDGV